MCHDYYIDDDGDDGVDFGYYDTTNNIGATNTKNHVTTT